MIHLARLGAGCGIALTLATVSCTAPQNPSPSSTTTPAAVSVTPLDASRYLDTPCAAVPVDLTARLGLHKREEAHDTVLPGAGDQSQCRFSSGPPLSAAAEVRLYPRKRPTPLVTGVGAHVRNISVDGYSAVEWVLSTGTDGSFTSCQVIVNIASNQGLGVLFNGPSGEPITTTCSKANQLATGVITNLRN
jgi:hypothetical protein